MASLFLHVGHLHVKGGVPEHRDSGLLLALQPSPSGYVHGITTWLTSDGWDKLEGQDPRM